MQSAVRCLNCGHEAMPRTVHGATRCDHGRWFANSKGMKVRITRAPRGVVDGMSLHYFLAGATYDVTPQLAEYLVAEGFASIEMRQSERSATRSAADHDRRRSSVQPAVTSSATSPSREHRMEYSGQPGWCPPPSSDALVVFGVTGDLAYKKIFPALQALVTLAAS